MKKIVVGLGFGAGLTEDGELYLWGGGPHAIRCPNSHRIMEFGAERRCFCRECDNEFVQKRKLGGFDLSYCPSNSAFLTCSVGKPGFFGPERTFANATVPLFCCSCGRVCTGLDVIMKEPPRSLVCSHRLNYCENCDLLQEASCTSSALPEKNLIPQKILSSVTDLDCGASFICVSHGHNQLSVLSWQKTSHWDTPAIYVSVIGPSLPISSFSCGVAHIAAVTDQGKLYTYGYGIGGNIGVGGETMQLVSMQLISGNQSPVTEVYCGRETTMCLLADHSIWLIYEDCQRIITSVLRGNSFDLGSNFFANFIGYMNLVDWFFLEDSSHSVWNVQKLTKKAEVEVFRGENEYTALFSALKLAKDGKSKRKEEKSDINPHSSLVAIPKSHVGLEPVDDNSPHEKQIGDCEHGSSAMFQPTTQCQSSMEELEGPEKTDDRPSLFGKTLLSDLTFKLADGDFPAHSFMLFMASNYFRKLFSSSDAPPKELDVSSYNAKAYKTLLQYFYSEKPDDIGLQDLLDLYKLAVSYDETFIFKTISSQLMSLVDVDTVLFIMTKAKSYNDKPLISKCEEILHSPAYIEKMILSIKQDPSKFIH